MMRRCISYFFCLLAALILVACGKSTEERWQEQYDLGQKHLIELDYEQALTAFTNAIEIDPKRGEAYIGRGDTYMAMVQAGGEVENAAEYLQNAREDYETGLLYLDLTFDLVEKLADVYVQQKDTGALAELLDRAREELPNDPEFSEWVRKLPVNDDETAPEEEAELDNDALAEITDWQAFGDEMIEELALLHLHDFFGTDAQRKEALQPQVEPLQRLMEEDSDRKTTYAKLLEDVYYMMGDVDARMALREQMYAETGEEWFDPQGHSETIDDPVWGGDKVVYYNGLGLAERVEDRFSFIEFSYDSDWKPVTEKNGSLEPDPNIPDLYDYVTYDAEGRMEKIGGDGWYDLHTYEGNHVTVASYYQLDDGTYEQDWDWTWDAAELDKYGYAYRYWYHGPGEGRNEYWVDRRDIDCISDETNTITRLYIATR